MRSISTVSCLADQTSTLRHAALVTAAMDRLDALISSASYFVFLALTLAAVFAPSPETIALSSVNGNKAIVCSERTP